MLNLDILKLGFPSHDVADDVTNLDKCVRMINDKCQNLKKYIHLPCKMDQIGIVNVANTQCNILFGHSAPQAVKTRKYRAGRMVVVQACNIVRQMPAYQYYCKVCIP